MKVKIVREVITQVVDIEEMSPELYCSMRAGKDERKKLGVEWNGNVTINVKSIEPYSNEDEKELIDFWKTR